MLRCQECNKTSVEFDHGWCAFYATLEGEPEVKLLTYCADCARLEFESMLYWLIEGAPTGTA